jgi:parallel beta-helix repeat protein
LLQPSSCGHSGCGYVALINSYNITVRGLELKNNEQGVELYNTTNSRIANNNLTKNRFGVYLDYLSDNNTVSENNITDNRYGVGVATMGKAVVEKNEISGNSESGILIVGESDVLIKENIIKLNSRGISTDGSAIHSGIVVVGNTIIENGNGVSLGSDANGYCSLHDITFSSNNVSSNGWSGITLWTSSGYSGYSDLCNVTFSSNVVLANCYYGTELRSFGVGDGAWPMGPGYSYLRDVVFSSNNISANGYYGIFLHSEGRGYYDNGYSYLCNVTFCSNTLIGNGANPLFGNGGGIILQSASSDVHGGSNHDKLYNVTFSSNTVLANNGDGIYLYSYGNAESHLYNVTLSSNIVSSNGENGILAKARDHYTEFDLAMSNNTLSSNHQKGIWIDGGINANLTHNSISYNTYGVFYSTSTNNSAKYNDIYRNSYGMNVTTDATVNATYNYWGDASGPYHESLNVNGSGNSVNGNRADLEFIPFLTNPVGDINERPVAVLTADRILVIINQTVTFDASASTDDDRVDYYFLDFGDGTNSGWTTTPLVTHKYASRGVFNVTLMVMDNLGVPSFYGDLTAIKVVASPVAGFTYFPEFPSISAVVTFNASESYYMDGEIESYRWDFGDGNITVVTESTITHAFTVSGTYSVNLTVTSNDQFTHSLKKSITVWNISSTLTLNLVPTTVPFGSNLTLYGTITPLVAGVPVTIFYNPPDFPYWETPWETLATVETDSNSQYNFTWTMTYPGEYAFQASWPGSGDISPARSDIKTAIFYNSIYIRPDGSIYPSNPPMKRDGDLYTLTGNVSVGIIVEKDNIVIDGAHYTVRGYWPLGSVEYWVGIDLSERSNVTVRNINVIGFYNGITLDESSFNVISGNSITDNIGSIGLYRCSNNVIVGNNITANHNGVGVGDSKYNRLSGNNITNNGNSGVYLSSSSDNIICGNYIANNSDGIFFNDSPNNTITGNIIAANKGRGIYFPSWVSPSNNNTIYHNNFVNNTYQVSSSGSMNVWDNGVEGNYWSDYTGQDLNGDGIGDTPYTIDESNQDRYPLMAPCAPDVTCPMTLHGYDDLWHTTDLTITLTATDDLSGVAETYYKINNGPTKTVSIDGQPRITIEGANNTLEYWSVDNAGNEELPHKILTGIKLDKTAPTGSIIVSNGDAYTTSTSVTLTLTASDATSGVYQMRFSNDGTTWTDWEAYTTSKSWTLPSEDGTKTVHYQIKDNAGLISETYTDTIVLDTTIPNIETPTREPADNIQPDQTVKVSVNVTDATSQVKNVTLSYTINDGETWTDLPMNHTTSNLYEATIPPQQADTTVRFRIIAYDYAGNNATLDGTQPYCVYQVIPEFPSSLISPIFMIITLLAATAYKRKHLPL